MGDIITAVFGANPTLTSIALGVIVLVFVALVTGQLVPKWTVKSLLEARNERVAQANLRAEDYKKLYELEHETAETARAQVNEILVPYAETTRRVVTAIPVPVDESEGARP